jgi:hypothetical protein
MNEVVKWVGWVTLTNVWLGHCLWERVKVMACMATAVMIAINEFCIYHFWSAIFKFEIPNRKW